MTGKPERSYATHEIPRVNPATPFRAGNAGSVAGEFGIAIVETRRLSHWQSMTAFFLFQTAFYPRTEAPGLAEL
jgi:hypothetical protein